MQQHKLKIGLMLNGYAVPAWFYSSLERISRSGCAEIQLVIINQNSYPSKSKLSRFVHTCPELLYRIFKKLDETIFRSKPDAFEPKDVRHLIGAATYLTLSPIQKKDSDCIEESDIRKIKSFDLDIIIENGFRILRGEILNVSRYGIWSYHHGDNIVNRGGPAGFWEVAEGRTETGCILEALSESPGGGKILYRSWSPTYQLSVAKNTNGYHWTSAAFLPRQIERLYHLGEEKFFADIEKYNSGLNCYDGKLHKIPTNIDTLSISVRVVYRLIKRILRQVFYRKQWVLMVDLGPGLSTSFRKFKKILPPKDRLWADPFVVRRNGRYTLFIEELLYHERKGHISAIEIDERGRLGTPQPVLKENYHLSYPFILEWKGRYYMVPETSSAGAIRIYECQRFPDKWTFKMSLIEDIIAVDATLIYRDDTWWLFAGVAENRGVSKSVELSLFYSKELFSQQWTPHPMNPIVSDVRNARPAGRLIEKNGKLYRVAQDCSKGHGHAVNINEIVLLTKDLYEEKKVERVSPRWDKTLLGIHTFNHAHKVTVIDALIWRSRFFLDTPRQLSPSGLHLLEASRSSVNLSEWA